MQFIAISEERLAIPAYLQGKDEHITYQVEFERQDRSTFSSQEARELLDSLSLFLSFCQGQWVAFSFATATGPGGDVELEQWGTGRLSKWREPFGWLDEHHGESIIELYESFLTRLQDNSWHDAFSAIVYWFARADTNNVGPDGSLILLQAALERLSWQVLVIDRGFISESAFDSMRADEQLRAMLKQLSIPFDVPASLQELAAVSKSRRSDGPGVLTFVRNRLVHPPTRGRTARGLPFYEAYSLAKWYAELCVLSVCGYKGTYGNRTRRNPCKGEVEPVPWV